MTTIKKTELEELKKDVENKDEEIRGLMIKKKTAEN